MEDKIPVSLKGQFLIAMPGLADPNFSYSVSCVCEHTSEGTLGIVINRVHPMLSAKNIFEELDMEFDTQAESIPIHMGGPVHMNEVFILHGPPFEWEGCLMISPTLAMSNTMDILKAIAAQSGPEAFIIAMGCAGWGGGQLEFEIRENSWLTSPVDQEILFKVAVEQRWPAAVKKMGIDPALLSIHAGHA